MITEFESWASEGASKGKLNKNGRHVSLCTETGLFNLRDRYVCVCVCTVYLLTGCCSPGVCGTLCVLWSHTVQTGSHTTAGPQSLQTASHPVSRNNFLSSLKALFQLCLHFRTCQDASLLLLHKRCLYRSSEALASMLALWGLAGTMLPCSTPTLSILAC